MSINKTSEALKQLLASILPDFPAGLVAHDLLEAIAQKYKRMEETLEFLLGANSIADHYKNHISEALDFDPLSE